MPDLSQCLNDENMFSSAHLQAIGEECASAAIKTLKGEYGSREALSEIMGMLGLLFLYFAHVERQGDAILDQAASEFQGFVEEGVAQEACATVGGNEAA
jgi:hypothetical protein